MVLAYAAVQVRAWNDTQRPILLTAVVDVEPHRNHVLQHFGRWLDVEQVGLIDKVRTLGLDAVVHGNGHVLVPWNFPVRVRNLVEEDAPNRKGSLSENRLDQRSDCLRVRQFPHLRRHVQQVADGEGAIPLAHRSGVADALQRGK